MATLHAQTDEEQRARLLDVAGRCPVPTLMTTVDVTITTRAAAS